MSHFRLRIATHTIATHALSCSCVHALLPPLALLHTPNRDRGSNLGHDRLDKGIIERVTPGGQGQIIRAETR